MRDGHRDEVALAYTAAEALTAARRELDAAADCLRDLGVLDAVASIDMARAHIAVAAAEVGADG